MDDVTVERENPLDTFAAKPEGSGSTGTAMVLPAFAAPVDRVFGAQQVAVRRDEGAILQKLKTMAAAAGDDWFYRFPVKKKVKNEVTGKDEWVKDWIEGPSIKCANNVSRLYGNCDVDTRVFDVGDSYMFYARFMDIETGYSLTRPFRQRKGQTTMRTDAGRAEDIVFQIGASKAIRNVINNALEFFANFAFDEARNSIIDKVGKNLPAYRDKVLQRLAGLNVAQARVEKVRGRAVKDWLAPDVARTIAEIQAINDGMATVDDTYPPLDAKPEDAEGNGEANGKMDQFADKQQSASQANETSSGDAKPAAGEGASASGSSPQGAKATDAPEAKTEKKKPEATKEMPAPETDAQYSAFAGAWIDKVTDADAAQARWKSEKPLRKKCIITQETFEELEAALNAKVAELRGGK